MLKQHTLKNEQFGHDRNFFSKDVEEKKNRRKRNHPIFPDKSLWIPAMVYIFTIEVIHV